MSFKRFQRLYSIAYTDIVTKCNKLGLIHQQVRQETAGARQPRIDVISADRSTSIKKPSSTTTIYHTTQSTE